MSELLKERKSLKDILMNTSFITFIFLFFLVGLIFSDYVVIKEILYFNTQAEYFDVRLNTECKFRFENCFNSNNGTIVDTSSIYNSYIRDDRLLMCYLYSELEDERKSCDSGFFQGNTFYSTKRDNCSIVNSKSNATLADCNYLNDKYWSHLAPKNNFIFLAVIIFFITFLVLIFLVSWIRMD